MKRALTAGYTKISGIQSVACAIAAGKLGIAVTQLCGEVARRQIAQCRKDSIAFARDAVA